MALASTLARGSNMVVGVIALAIMVLASACSSPLDLDVDRSKTYVDGSLHPQRLQLYYYFGDSAYEAIVTDTALLNSIWIETLDSTRAVTLPRLQFSLPDTIKATAAFTPFVRTFCIAAQSKPCNGVFTMCINPNSWISGDYRSQDGQWYPFHWMSDNRNRQLRLAFYEIPGERLIKGSLQILVADPETSRYETYRALLTIEI